MSTISVVVPVYRVEKYLDRCITSILNQTYRDFNLVLIDDGSPDSCGDICDEYASKDNRIHVIHQKNKGLSEARNTGIEWVNKNSDSKWITFIDSDDWVHCTYLQMLYDAVKKNDVNISICLYQKTVGEVPQIDIPQESICIYEVEDFWMKYRTNATIACGKLYKKCLFETIKYPTGRLYEDEYTTYKILFSEKKVALILIPLYFYFQNIDGITHADWNIKQLDMLDAFQQQIEFFKKKNYRRALKSSSRLYIEKLLYHLEYTKKYNIENKTGLKGRLRKAYWKYGKICDMYPSTEDGRIFKTVCCIKTLIYKKIRKKYMNLLEITKGR